MRLRMRLDIHISNSVRGLSKLYEKDSPPISYEIRLLLSKGFVRDRGGVSFIIILLFVNLFIVFLYNFTIRNK